MKLGLLFLNFTPQSLAGPVLNLQTLSSTEDGLSVTVTNDSTSIVQFSFYDLLRNRQQVKNETEIKPEVKPEVSSNEISCTNQKSYHLRMADTVEVDESAKNKIPELFWNYEKISEKQEYVVMPKTTSSTCKCGTDVLILVKTALSHFDRRAAIRRVWNKFENVSVYFVTGIPAPHSDDKNHFNSVLEEANKNGDMIIGNFYDTYSNLTDKSLLSLKWATEECSNFGYLGLVDDDIQMDVQKIITQVQLREKLEKQNDFEKSLEYVQCLHMIQNKARVMRRGKWQVDKAIYPLEYYPQICTGAGILIPNRAADMLYKISKQTKSFPIDDVFISGILRLKIGLSIRGPGVFRNGTVKVIQTDDVASMI